MQASKPPRTFDDYKSHYQSATPVDAITEVLSLASQLEPHLNAFITLAQEHALIKARSLESPSLPLRGIPFAVKDLIDIAGLPTTCGSRASSSEPVSESATVVRRLEDVGGVVIGKTNLLEYAYGAVHPDIGDTRNPWNVARTAGGSSGGSAAAVAAGICPLALGSDTGGSVRIPAAYCGVVGLKPSYGLLPMDGVMPLSFSLDHVGSLTRTCRDALRALAVLADKPEMLAIPPRPLSHTRVGVPQTYLEGVDLQPGVAAAFEAALDALQASGVTLEKVDIWGIDGANDALIDLLYPEASVIHEQNMQEREHLYGPATWQQLKDGFDRPAALYVKAQRFQRVFAERLRADFSEVDFLVMPTAPWVAPEEDPAVSGEEGVDEMHFTGPFNLSGDPALSLPWGVADGLPIGLQIVAARGHDAELLAFAEHLEGLAPPLGHPPLPDLRDSGVD